MEYAFTLKFVLPASPRRLDALAEYLGNAGRDGVLPDVGAAGRIALEFSCASDSAKSAILSALATAKAGLPGAKLIEVAPDFVGLSDIAAHVGVSRQNIRKLMLRHPDDFPVPVHEGSAALWHLAPVLDWLRTRAGYAIPAVLLEVAHIAMQINLASEANQADRNVHSELIALVV